MKSVMGSVVVLRQSSPSPVFDGRGGLEVRALSPVESFTRGNQLASALLLQLLDALRCVREETSLGLQP